MPRTKTFDESMVLQKAMELFWKKGFHATSIQDLVDHLGVNRASLYDTFGGKKSLFEKAFKRYVGINSKSIRAFLDQHTSVREGLKALFTRAIEQSLSDPDGKGCFVVNTTTELLPADPFLADALAANKRAFVNLFRDYLEQGVRTGEIDEEKDLEAIAILLFTLYNGLQVVSKLDDDAVGLQRSLEAALGVLEG